MVCNTLDWVSVWSARNRKIIQQRIWKLIKKTLVLTAKSRCIHSALRQQFRHLLVVVPRRFYWHSLGLFGAIMARLPVATSNRSQTLKLVSWAPECLHSPPVTFTVRPRAKPVLTRCDRKRMCYFYILGSFRCLSFAVAFIWSVRSTNSQLLA